MSTVVLCGVDTARSRLDSCSYLGEADELLPSMTALTAHPLLQQAIGEEQDDSQFVAVFHSSLMDLMQDHTIHGRTLFPGAGFVEMALAAQLRHMGKRSGGGVELRDVSFLEPLDLDIGTELALLPSEAKADKPLHPLVRNPECLPDLRRNRARFFSGREMKKRLGKTVFSPATRTSWSSSGRGR